MSAFERMTPADRLPAMSREEAEHALARFKSGEPPRYRVTAGSMGIARYAFGILGVFLLAIGIVQLVVEPSYSPAYRVFLLVAILLVALACQMGTYPRLMWDQLTDEGSTVVIVRGILGVRLRTSRVVKVNVSEVTIGRDANHAMGGPAFTYVRLQDSGRAATGVGKHLRWDDSRSLEVASLLLSWLSRLESTQPKEVMVETWES